MNLKPTILATTLAVTALASVPAHTMPNSKFCSEMPLIVAGMIMDKRVGAPQQAPLDLIQEWFDGGALTQPQYQRMIENVVIVYEHTHLPAGWVLWNAYAECVADFPMR